MLATTNPFPFYPDLEGAPLDSGSIYFGVANQNPEISPVQVYWDFAGTQPAAQPLKTLDGYVVRAGTPALVFAAADYSITVRDSRGRMVFYVPSAALANNSFALQAQITQLSSDLASQTDVAKGSSLIGQPPDTGGSVGQTVFNILKERTSFSRFLTSAQQTDMLSGALTLDLTTPLQTALAERAGKKLTLPGMVKVTGSLTVGTSTIFEGESRNNCGIVQFGTNLPILQMGSTGGGCEHAVVQHMMLKYNALQVASTSSAAIRGYNVYESEFDDLYIQNAFNGIDQYQGLVGGGQNAFFSNNVHNVRVVQFSGYAIDLLPFGGGNSGNYFENIYVANRNAGAPSTNTACLGALRMATSQDGVFNQLNLEWCKNAGPLIILNQCGNPTFNGLHLEGNYPQNTFGPLIDILGGDGSAPKFNEITLAGNDFSTGAGFALFRVPANGVRIEASGILSNSNTSVANMSLVTFGGASCYGSILDIYSCNDLDGALSSDAYTPKVSLGTATAGLEYPVQRFNLNIAKHSGLVSDNVGGTNSTVAAMPGVVAQPYNDGMGLWTAASTLFTVKQPGNYLCQCLIPTGASPAIQIKKNGTTTVTFVLPAGGGHDSVVLSCARGDTIQFVLASGSYTRTGVSCGISLAS